MQVVRITSSQGLDNIKLIGENDLELLFIQQLASAGTLSCISRSVNADIIFKPIVANLIEESMQEKIVKIGEMLVFKKLPNTNNLIIEPGDYCIGFVEGQFISANYLGGDKTLLSSFDI